MIKKSPFWRSLYSAWELSCDWELPHFCRVAISADEQRQKFMFNPLHVMPLWAAVGGLLFLIFGKLLSSMLPVNGAALLFALLLVIAGELRTSSRGLALNVTFWENLCGNRNFAQAYQNRKDSLRGVSGVIAVLLSIALLGGKFLMIFLVARTGHFGVASAGWVAALTAEAVMAADPNAVKVPGFCREGRAEYIVALGGFLLLFNLISLPLATLVSAGCAAAVVIILINTFIRKCSVISSNDMTMTGYLAELTVWLCMAVMIG